MQAPLRYVLHPVSDPRLSSLSSFNEMNGVKYFQGRSIPPLHGKPSTHLGNCHTPLIHWLNPIVVWPFTPRCFIGVCWNALTHF